MSRVLWFRRDLRIHDNPALVEAVEGAWADGDGNVVAVVLIVAVTILKSAMEEQKQ